MAEHKEEGGIMGWFDDIKKERRKKYNPKDKKHDSGQSFKYKGKSAKDIYKKQDEDAKRKKRGYAHGGTVESRDYSPEKKAREHALMIIIGGPGKKRFSKKKKKN